MRGLFCLQSPHPCWQTLWTHRPVFLITGHTKLLWGTWSWRFVLKKQWKVTDCRPSFSLPHLSCTGMDHSSLLHLLPCLSLKTVGCVLLCRVRDEKAGRAAPGKLCLLPTLWLDADVLWQPLGIMVEQTPSSQGRKGERKGWIRNKHPEAVLDYGSLRQETDPQHFYRGFS